MERLQFPNTHMELKVMVIVVGHLLFFNFFCCWLYIFDTLASLSMYSVSAAVSSIFFQTETYVHIHVIIIHMRIIHVHTCPYTCNIIRMMYTYNEQIQIPVHVQLYIILIRTPMYTCAYSHYNSAGIHTCINMHIMTYTRAIL